MKNMQAGRETHAGWEANVYILRTVFNGHVISVVLVWVV